jgi:hypothetical protein
LHLGRSRIHQTQIYVIGQQGSEETLGAIHVGFFLSQHMESPFRTMASARWVAEESGAHCDPALQAAIRPDMAPGASIERFLQAICFLPPMGA